MLRPHGYSEDKPPATPATVTRREVEQKPTSSDEQSGWVLCALKAQQRMSAESAAVSFPMMAILTVVLLFAFLSWPFLKLILIGEAQRVKVADVVLVGFCALLGVALITVGVLGFYGHRRLQALLDDQLQRFAASIIDQTNKEVENAYLQMTRIEDALGRCRKTGRAHARPTATRRDPNAAPSPTWRATRNSRLEFSKRIHSSSPSL